MYGPSPVTSRTSQESTSSLRQRLKIPSPQSALGKLLKGRIKRCMDSQGVQRFRHVLARLEAVAESESPANGRLIALTEGDQDPVACSVCGIYFPSMRILLSHKAGKHGVKKTESAPVGKQYVQHTVDGMPECIHCRRTFPRVENLK